MLHPKIVASVCAVGSLIALAALCRGEQPQAVAGAPSIESEQLAASFDPATGSLVALKNKLTGEVYPVAGDAFRVEMQDGNIAMNEAQLVALERKPTGWTAKYRRGETEIETAYTLRGHFLEKRAAVTFPQPTALLKVEISRPTFDVRDMTLVSYGYPKFGRKPGAEPCRTFFGRTNRGGLFTGIEMPFADVGVADAQIQLAFAPHLKLSAAERFDCEPIYFGVYRRLPGESTDAVEPLRSEADAMVAMTSAVLGPPRHGLAPMACGWHSEMQQFTCPSVASVESDMKSLDFLAECGIDYVSDSHPWGGETDKLNRLTDDQPLEIGELNRQFLAYAEKAGVKVVTWLTMNNSHPWWPGHGKPFRSDKPDWLLVPDADRYRGVQHLDPPPHGNCVANQPFLDWLLRVNRQAMTAGKSQAWVVDGDFFGGPGWFTSVVPVRCLSEEHDHLPGDSNYGCQRALDRLLADVRQFKPDMYIFTCRPAQDLGIWSQRNVDVCFTLVENGTPPDNIAGGDEIRHWSRIRVHRDFFPHYLDQPLLFPSYSGDDLAKHRWQSSEHLDYILLSALSSAPNQLFYLPTKSGMPAADKAELRRWLDWGREHIRYLLVRKDLPAWPAAGAVDGSAHIIGDRGFVFLFNRGEQPLEAEIALTSESLGLTRGERFRVRQHYPESDKQMAVNRGQTIRWQVPGKTALVLEVEPMEANK